MKKELAALALLTALFAAALYNVHYLEQLIGGISDLVTESYESLLSGDSASAESTLEKAISRWETADGYTHIFIRHSEIDAASDAMFDALGSIRSGDDEALGAFRSLFYHLDSMVRIEQISLGSIF